MEFSQKLKELLENQGISQANLCKKTGIQTSLMSDYVSGKKSPAISNAIAIADALDITLDELVGRDEMRYISGDLELQHETKNTFAIKLKEKMIERNIKASELSRLSGVTEASISEYLSGKKEPMGKQSILIAKALKTSLDELWETGFQNQEIKDVRHGFIRIHNGVISKYEELSPENKKIIDRNIEFLLQDQKNEKEPLSTKTDSIAAYKDGKTYDKTSTEDQESVQKMRKSGKKINE